MLNNSRSNINKTYQILNTILLLLLSVICNAENQMIDSLQTSEKFYIDRAYLLLKNKCKNDSVLYYSFQGLKNISKS